MSYSDKENINILCAVLLGHGVRHAVVCPGSRNAPIVHNFNECPPMNCYPVTDERSAGFFALGMAEQLGEPVAVCGTSGTALLDLAPAVAEARHRHLSLIVISADRPMAHIGQQMGQTIDQPGALSRWTLADVNLIEPHDELTRWHCNRMANEALLAARRGGPVHFNVPYDEPLFNFTVPELPNERIISRLPAYVDIDNLASHLAPAIHAERPMLVIGQMPQGCVPDEVIKILSPCFTVLVEALGANGGGAPFDEVLPQVEANADFKPDCVIYMGGTLVSKRLKAYLRHLEGVPMIEVSEDGEIHDTFGHLSQVVTCHPTDALQALAKLVEGVKEAKPFAQRRNHALDKAKRYFDALRPDFSQMLAVKLALQSVQESELPYILHLPTVSPSVWPICSPDGMCVAIAV